MTTPFTDRPLAITDVETTGMDFAAHEMIEIGLVVVDQRTLQVQHTWETKVKPVHTETADPRAFAVNGYDPALWGGAVSLEEAMRSYAAQTKGAIFCSHNVTFDWGFVEEAFRRTGVPHELDHHRVDLFSVAWTKLYGTPIERFSLSRVAASLGLGEELMPHRALNGALKAYEVMKKLMETRG